MVWHRKRKEAAIGGRGYLKMNSNTEAQWHRENTEICINSFSVSLAPEANEPLAQCL